MRESNLFKPTPEPQRLNDQQEEALTKLEKESFDLTHKDASTEEEAREGMIAFYTWKIVGLIQKDPAWSWKAKNVVAMEVRGGKASVLFDWFREKFGSEPSVFPIPSYRPTFEQEIFDIAWNRIQSLLASLADKPKD